MPNLHSRTLVGLLKVDGLHDVEQPFGQLARVHAMAPLLCMTVPTGAGRTPSSLKRTPSASSTSTTRQRCVYIAPGMASRGGSHLRIEWRQRPAHSARPTVIANNVTSVHQARAIGIGWGALERYPVRYP